MNFTNTPNTTQASPQSPLPLGSSLARKVISSFAIAVLIILTLFGNSLVIAAFYRYKRIRSTVTNWFILSLAISDLLVACLSEPFWLSIEITEWQNFPEDFNITVFVTFWTMLDIVCAVSSIVNLMFISIDRYFAIKSPLVHHTRMAPEIAKWIIPVLWGYGVLTSCLFLVQWHWTILLLFVVGFLIPLLVMVFCYAGILQVVVRRTRFTGSSRGARRMNREFKTARSLGVVTGAFVVCWLPFFIVSLAYQYCAKCHAQIDELRAVPSAVKWLHYLNSCLNPIIYAFLNPTFKLAFKNLFKNLCGKNELNTLDDSSFSFSFRRRTSLKSSTGSFRKRSYEENKHNGQIPNGNTRPIPARNPTWKTRLVSILGKKPRESIQESSSTDESSAKRVLEGTSVEKLEDNLSSAKDSTRPLLGAQSYTAGSEDTTPTPGGRSNQNDSDNDQSPGDTFPSRQRSGSSRRKVSFSDQGELSDGSRFIEKEDSILESPVFEGELSTFLDQETNQYYFLVDGVMIPDEDIKCSDV